MSTRNVPGRASPRKFKSKAFDSGLDLVSRKKAPARLTAATIRALAARDWKPLPGEMIGNDVTDAIAVNVRVAQAYLRMSKADMVAALDRLDADAFEDIDRCLAEAAEKAKALARMIETARERTALAQVTRYEAIKRAA